MKPELGESTPPQRTSRPIRPSVVLYLPAFVPGTDSSDEAVGDALAKVPGWSELEKAFGGRTQLAPRRAFKNSEGLERLIAKATANAERSGVKGYRPLDYQRYFLLSIPKGSGKPLMDTYCELKAGLARLGGQVYLSMPTRSAQASNDYVGAADPLGGIGATSLVSGHTGQAINGSGQWIVDVEKAWLSPGGPVALQMVNLPSSVNTVESAELADIHHGTAVAGIVLGSAINNTALGGIAPGARFFKGACLELTGSADPSQILASTILDAAVQLDLSPQGSGVLLIEQETWDAMPIETLPLEFAAIQTAAAAGHIVVQPAGNGGQNLDELTGIWLDATRAFVPRPLGPDPSGPTSGAITVAAAHSGRDATLGKLGERSPTSNFGHLVDCWAWGDSIATLGVTRNASGDAVAFADPAGFGGTSGAAAIVAGAVLLLQQLRAEANPAPPQTQTHMPLNAGELRPLLRNAALGTTGQVELKERCMPDLAKLRLHLGL
jgi:Subtilase family